VQNLVSGIREVDSTNEYLLLCRAGDRAGLQDWGPNFRPLELAAMGDYTMAHQSTEQLLLPIALDALAPDVYLAPYYVFPLERRYPAVSVFDDMIPWIVMKRLHDRIPPGQIVGEDMASFQTWKRLCAQSAESVIGISNHTGDDLSAFWDVDRGKIETVYVGLEPEWYREAADDEIGSFRARFGLPDRYLLYTGTVEPRKNVEGIIAAYGMLRRRYGHTLPLVVAGSRGQQFDRLFLGGVQREVGALRFSHERGHFFDDVVLMTRFLSRREQILLYRSASAFVWPSFYEGFGLPVLEAMACGLPVVTAQNSSLPEVGGDAVLYADPRLPESIAAGLDRVLTDRDFAADLGQRAAARARTFTNAEAGRRCVDLLARVASAGRRVQPATQKGALAPSLELSADEAGRLANRLTAEGDRVGAIVIYGAGQLGLDLARALGARGHDVVGLTDADPSKWGLTLDRWPILSIADMFRCNPSAIVLGSRASAADMRAKLLELGFARDRIWALDGGSPAGY
jgi:glycosyltransferase involved in cell wall biosynthesis